MYLVLLPRSDSLCTAQIIDECAYAELAGMSASARTAGRRRTGRRRRTWSATRKPARERKVKLERADSRERPAPEEYLFCALEEVVWKGSASSSRNIANSAQRSYFIGLKRTTFHCGNATSYTDYLYHKHYEVSS